MSLAVQKELYFDIFVLDPFRGFADYYYIIYKTTNLENGKIYIGYHQTKELEDDYLGSGKDFKKDLKEYGEINFKFEVLEFCICFDHMRAQEKYWIREFNATDKGIGYNIHPGGCGGDHFTNNPNKEEIRRKNREAHIGKGLGVKRSEKAKQKHLRTVSTEEYKINQKESYLQRPEQSCKWCGYSTRNISNLKQFHGDNCKYNPNYIPKKIIQLQLTCQYCGYTGNAGNIAKSHGDNCKQNPNYVPKENTHEMTTCPHCGFKSIGEGMMERWHFDNCKQNPNYIPKPDTRELKTCQYCGFQSKANNVMIQFHGDNCKQNPNYVPKSDSVTQETRDKISIAIQNRPVKTCPYCGKQSKCDSYMKWYHFDNCKKKSKFVRTS